LPNGVRFEGLFENGLPHGYIKYHNPNGEAYEGDCLNGKWDGEGVMVYSTGESYRG